MKTEFREEGCSIFVASKWIDYAERIILLSGRRTVQRAGLCNEEDA